MKGTTVALKELFARLSSKQSERQVERRENLTDMIRTVVDGDDVDADVLLDALENAGWTIEQFHLEVERVVGRKAQASTLAKRPAIRKKIDRLEAESKRLNDEFEEIAREHKAKQQVLFEKLSAANSENSRCDHAERLLRETVGAEFKERLADIAERAKQAHSRLRPLKERFDENTNNCVHATEREFLRRIEEAERTKESHRIPELEAELSTFQKRTIQPLRAALEEAQEAVEEVDREREELLAKATDPYC